jgi:hypothetical protein
VPAGGVTHRAGDAHLTAATLGLLDQAAASNPGAVTAAAGPMGTRQRPGFAFDPP